MSAEAGQVRVLIVDDHPLMRVGVAAMIKSQNDMAVVGQAGTAEEAVALFAQHAPDVTLMDLRLPDQSGVEAIRRILARNLDARIIVLTTYEGDEDIHQALSSGARGYLIKGMSQNVLLQAIRRVHAGQLFMPPVVVDAMQGRIPALVLSQREQEVLKCMFEGKSNREIAQVLDIRESTVKTHVGVILTKLNVEDRTQAVVEALRRGLVHL